MKKIIVMLTLFLTGGLAANAQTAKPVATTLPKAVTAQLQLTADQQTKIDAIMMAKAKKLDSLNAADPQLADKATKKAKRGVNMDAEANINNVLTDNQRKIYADFMAARKEKNQAKLQAAKDMATKPVTPPGN